MQDPIMFSSIFLFALLFSFLLFIGIIFIISIFKRKHYPDFKPDVSIMIPAYNEEKNIKQCLKSIFNSNYPEEKIEIIVVDDGSTDNTKNIVKGFKKVKLLEQKHAGKVEALNKGTLSCKNDYILCLDADTEIDKNFITEILKPFTDKKVGAITGACYVKNKNTLSTIFQNIEYHYNNLIRSSFSHVFDNGIWLFGALTCYRKSMLKDIGYFKKDTLTEDMDISLEIKKYGYKCINVPSAKVYTIVPNTFRELYKQRSRWWIGGLQSLIKNRKLFSRKSSPSTLFIFFNQYWWTFYSFISIPIIIYQVNYWMPAEGLTSTFMYLFRWFSIFGPGYVIYKIPEWGISFYSIFGVLSGIISALLIIFSIRRFKDSLNLKNIFAIIFYFPYTIVLNTFIILSIVSFRVKKNKFFIR